MAVMCFQNCINYNENGTRAQRAQNCPSVGVPWCSSALFVPARPNHRKVTEAPRLCNCKVTDSLWHWGFYRYLEPALASNPTATLTGGVSVA